MSYLLKTHPPDSDEKQAQVIVRREPSVSGGDMIRPGAEVFLWFTETDGGNGLAYQGHVVSVADRRPDIEVKVAMSNHARRAFTSNDIGMHRNPNAGRGQMIERLATKLYGRVGKKVAYLEFDEAECLRGYFCE